MLSATARLQRVVVVAGRVGDVAAAAASDIENATAAVKDAKGGAYFKPESQRA